VHDYFGEVCRTLYSAQTIIIKQIAEETLPNNRIEKTFKKLFAMKKIFRCKYSTIQYLRFALQVIWLFLPAFIIVCLIYYTLMGVEQGIDVLVQAGEYFWPAVIALIAVLFECFIVWYSSRLLSLVKPTEKKRRIP
jgi:hypothetical protein